MAESKRSQAQPPVDTSTTGRADGDTNKESSSDASPPEESQPTPPGNPPMQEPTLGTPDALAEYDDMSLNELRAEAKKQGVEINLDVEKALLVHKLRRAWAEGEDDDTKPSEATAARQGQMPLYDLLSLDELRKAAAEAGVGLSKEDERAHLMTELRAHRTGAPATAAPGKGAAHAREK